MNCAKEQAVEKLNALNERGKIPYDDYSDIYEGLTEIELLRDRDAELEELWEMFSDVPMNPETECIEEPFMGWGVGIHREEIWHWFDKRHSKGVYYLLYGDSGKGPHDKLLALMKAHPNLPIVPMVDSDIVCDDCGWWLGSWGNCEVSKYYNGRERIYFYDDEDIENVVTEVYGWEWYENASDEEAEAKYNEVAWVDCIVVYIKLPD